MDTPDSIYASAVDRFQSLYLIHLSGTGSAWVEFKQTTERLRTRMLPIKKAIPSLWKWVEDAIEENAAKGFLVSEANANTFAPASKQKCETHFKEE